MSEKFSNKSISQLLRNVATVYLLLEGSESEKNNRFKIIAYQKAADIVEQMPENLYEVWKIGRLQKVPGIGPGIGSKLDEYFRSGRSERFEEILAMIPSTVFTLMKIPGMGPKKAFKLVLKFGLVNDQTLINDLCKIADDGRIAELPGFGEKSQSDIIEGIELFKRKDKREERIPFKNAEKIADEIVLYLKKLSPIIKRIDTLGSLRRKEKTIGDIDIAAVVETSYKKGIVPKRDYPYLKIIEHFLKYPGVRSVEAAGDAKASILIDENKRVDLSVHDEDGYGTMLQYFTGSKAHNIKLREHALKKGYSLNEYGLKNLESGEVMKFANEELLYSFLGLEFIPPEKRRGDNEITEALK